MRLTAAHEIPPAFLSNEGIIKLKGNAARWFQTAFPGAADACPPWADVQSALLPYFTRRCTAAGAYCALNGARRIPGSTGPEAVQRVAELVLALNLKGVPLTAGPKEQLAHVCQNQLSEQEFSAWSAAANAHHEVSDAALAALESAAATDRGTRSRLSCSGATREHWFHGRAEHMRSFLCRVPWQTCSVAGTCSAARGTAPQRLGRAGRTPCAASRAPPCPAGNNDGLRPGPPLPTPLSPLGRGSARRPVCASARAAAGPSRRKDPGLRGQDQVHVERLGRLQPNGG